MVRDSDVIEELKNRLRSDCGIETGSNESPESMLAFLRGIVLVRRWHQVTIYTSGGYFDGIDNLPAGMTYTEKHPG
jgi:hypothetical protein